MTTLIELVQRTVTRLSMVAGPAVQLYAEDRIAEMIYHKFVVVRDELWWEDLCNSVTLTIGVDGRPVDNVVRELPPVPIGDEIVIHSHRDVQRVWPINSHRPLGRLPRRVNNTLLSNGSPRWWQYDSNKVLRVFPFGDGTAQVRVRYKRYWPMFQPGTMLPFDDQLLMLGTCYDYLEDDGTNPSQIEKFRLMFQQRLDRLKSMENNAEIPLGDNFGSTGGYQVVS